MWHILEQLTNVQVRECYRDGNAYIITFTSYYASGRIVIELEKAHPWARSLIDSLCSQHRKYTREEWRAENPDL